MSILKVSNLSHSYNSGKDWAVKNINFEIESKGIVGILGSNGAGKSTTMNIICGVINQTSGSVMINGSDIRKDAQMAKKNLGFLPQEAPLYLDLTVDEYLNHAARIRLMDSKSIPDAIERVKEKVNISHFSKRLIKNLSGGYRQRVGIAQAIIHQPQLVVLDEPTVGLDPNQIIEVRNLVREIAEDRAVMFSTHIMSEVELMCKDVIMIESGGIVYNGSLESFKQIDTPESVIIKVDKLIDERELMRITGVNKVEVIDNNKIRISFNEIGNITELLISESRDKDWKLHEIYYEQKSLDSIFAKLSKGISRN